MSSYASSVSSWDDNNDNKDNDNNTSDEKEYDSDGNELYVVEEIRDKRRQFDSKTKKYIWVYHLKWKGYGDKDMTWEPIHNLDCPDLLTKFETKWDQKHNRDKDSNDKQLQNRKDSLKKHTKKGFDSDKPSTSGLSKNDLKQAEMKSKTDSSKKRKIVKESDESDSSDDQKKKKVSKPGPKSSKVEFMAKNVDKHSDKKKSFDLENNNKKSTKNISNSDSDSDSKKLNISKKDFNDDIEKRILSKPGPKRAKEARIAKLKANETQKIGQISDDESNETLNKRTKNESLIDSDNDSNIKQKTKNDDKGSEDEKTKKLMSKPGPKRAKEARLARLNTSNQTTLKSKEDSGHESKDNNKVINSDYESQISDKTFKFTERADLEDEKKVLLSKPGPKRAKEARIAKLNSMSTPITIQNESSSEVKEINLKSVLDSDKNISNSDSINVLNIFVDNENKSDEELIRREKLMSKPGPKAAKEARIARLSALNSTPKKSQIDCETEEKINDKNVDKISNIETIKSIEQKSDSNRNSSSKLSLNSVDNDLAIDEKSNESNDKSIAIQEDERRKILSKPGPKRAKEARLKKIGESLKNSSSILSELDKSETITISENTNYGNNGLEKRTNSTDSLDAIISTPAPEQQSIEIEQQLSAQISINYNLTNGIDSEDPKPAPDSEMSNDSNTGNSPDMESLAKIGNYINISSTQYIDDISNALSIKNGALDMERPGFVKKQLNVKPFDKNNIKSVEKIVSAFYNDKKLCFLIKMFGSNKCDVVFSDIFNKYCPQMVIDYYQSNLRFN